MDLVHSESPKHPDPFSRGTICIFLKAYKDIFTLHRTELQNSDMVQNSWSEVM